MRTFATTPWATILAASPFYAVGFIGHEEPWLLAGLGLVLLSGFAARRGTPAHTPTPGSAARSSPASNV